MKMNGYFANCNLLQFEKVRLTDAGADMGKIRVIVRLKGFCKIQKSEGESGDFD